MSEQTSTKKYFDGLKGLARSDGYTTGGGFANMATGLGSFGRDKLVSGQYYDPIRISDPELQAMYHGNDLARGIIDQRPEEYFREGYQLLLPAPGGDQSAQADLAISIEEAAAALRVDELTKKAIKFGRLFGGVLLLVGADDGLPPDKPLDEKRIRSVRYLNFIDRRFCFVRSYYGDPMHPKFGEPESYLIVNSFGNQGSTVIHESRTVRFDGAEVDILKRRELAGWTLSSLQPVYDCLREFDTTFKSVAHLMTDASQGVMKMKGLIDMVAAQSPNGGAGGGDTLQTRMSLVDMSRSVARMLLLDSEEDFTRVATSFGGVPEVMDRLMMRLSASARTPVTVLFGRSPAGLNATGEADFRGYYGVIRAEQRSEVEPKLRRIYSLICLAKDGPTKGRLPKLEFHWRPLWTLNEKEQADLEKVYGDRDVAYVGAGILAPEEVALSRFRDGSFRTQTEIDTKAREKSLAETLSFAAPKDPEDTTVEQPETLTPEEPEDPQVGPLPQNAEQANESPHRAKEDR